MQASFGFPLAYSTSGRGPRRACGKHRPVQPRTAGRSGSRDRTYLIQLCQYRIQSGGMDSIKVLRDPHAMTAPSIADLVRFGHEQLAPRLAGPAALGADPGSSSPRRPLSRRDLRGGWRSRSSSSASPGCRSRRSRAWPSSSTATSPTCAAARSAVHVLPSAGPRGKQIESHLTHLGSKSTLTGDRRVSPPLRRDPPPH